LQKNRLIVFIKNPEAGKVKTRLARDVGPRQALDVYKKLLNYTRSVVLPVKADKQVWYSRFIEHNDLWQNTGFTQKLQKGDDLGERMKHAFEISFKQDDCRKVVLIGSDCAELTTSLVERAFSVLDENDVVLGPAADGGYYLIGMSGFLPNLFDNKQWSTQNVFSETIKDLKQHGSRFETLPVLSDVDVKKDWEKVASKLARF